LILFCFFQRQLAACRFISTVSYALVFKITHGGEKNRTKT
jgi:hypothetical protein